MDVHEERVDDSEDDEREHQDDERSGDFAYRLQRQPQDGRHDERQERVCPELTEQPDGRNQQQEVRPVLLEQPADGEIRRRDIEHVNPDVPVNRGRDVDEQADIGDEAKQRVQIGEVTDAFLFLAELCRRELDGDELQGEMDEERHPDEVEQPDGEHALGADHLHQLADNPWINRRADPRQVVEHVHRLFPVEDAVIPFPEQVIRHPVPGRVNRERVKDGRCEQIIEQHQVLDDADLGIEFHASPSSLQAIGRSKLS